MKIARNVGPKEWVGTFVVRGFPFKTPGDWFSIDTETTGLDPFGTFKVDRPFFPARPFAISLCNADGETAYIRGVVNRFTREVRLPDNAHDYLQDLLGDEGIAKVYHNRSFDRRMLKKAGFVVKGEEYDTLIGMHTINPDEFTFALKPLAEKYLGIADDDQKVLEESVKAIRSQVQRARKKDPDSVLGRTMIAEGDHFGDKPALADYWLADPKLCEEYAVQDAVRTAMLHIAQQEHLDEDEAEGGKLWSVYRRELSLMPVIEAMEDRGVCLDLKRNDEILKFYNEYLAKAKREIEKAGGKGLNPSSPKQMCETFYGAKGYTCKSFSFDKQSRKSAPCAHCKRVVCSKDGKPVIVPTTTKKGKTTNRKLTESPGCKICNWTGTNPKCDGEFLASIADQEPLAHWLLEYGAAEHMKTGFIEAYDLLKCKENGSWVLHPNYKQVGPVTARLACLKPNFMNVPSDTTGRKRSTCPYRPRESFVPRPGYLYYLPDYSQIEVWVFAHLSNDETMKKVLYSGGDYHGGISHQIWGHLWDHEVAKAAKKKDKKSRSASESKNADTFDYYRKRAKLIMFCKLYGGGAAKVGSLIGCTEDEAKKFIADYDARLPGVRRFMKRMIDQARREGKIINPFGRKYPIDPNFAYRATNYMIQGTSADIMKDALIRVYYDVSQKPEYKGKVHVLMTIHDEIIIEVHKSVHGKKLMRDIVAAMQTNHKKVGCPRPLPVGVKVAEVRWSETYEIEDLEEATA